MTIGDFENCGGRVSFRDQLKSAMGLSVTTPRYTPPKMIDESIGVLQHVFEENEDLLFLKRTKGG